MNDKDYQVGRKTTKELIKILYFEIEKYDQGIIPQIETVLIGRGVDAEERERLRTEIGKEISREKARLEKENSERPGCLGMIFDLVLSS